MTASRIFTSFAAAIAFGLAVTAMQARAADADSFVGTWVLNVEKSTYDPGPGPKSQTIKIEDLGDGKMKSTNDAVAQDGTETHGGVTYAYDGKDYPLSPPPAADSPGPDSVSFKQVDANTLEVTPKKGGTPLSTTVAKVSPDGKTLTATTSGTTPDGKPIKNVVVFDKQ